MSDKSWMLNPTAIAQAKICIQIIQDELGIKLKLSHPQFLEMIKEYIELTDSDELAKSYNQLAKLAGGQLQEVEREVVVPIAKTKPIATAAKVAEDVTVTDATPRVNGEEMIEYKGKLYPRYSDDGEFKGLYRGQARYA